MARRIRFAKTPRNKKHIRFGVGRGVVSKMAKGAALRCEHVGGRDRWSCDGVKLSLFVVRHLLKNPNVVALEDGLVVGVTQTFVHARLAQRLHMHQSAPNKQRKIEMVMNMSGQVKGNF
jgi:hypothetical protein